VQKLKEVFRRHPSQPIGRMTEEINPIVRGWVNYFRIGHAARCFRFVKDWVERKVRRHMMRARKRSGFGWNGEYSVDLRDPASVRRLWGEAFGPRLKARPVDKSHNPWREASRKARCWKSARRV
jgi:hypothetical protein